MEIVRTIGKCSKLCHWFMPIIVKCNTLDVVGSGDGRMDVVVESVGERVGGWTGGRVDGWAGVWVGGTGGRVIHQVQSDRIIYNK